MGNGFAFNPHYKVADDMHGFGDYRFGRTKSIKAFKMWYKAH